MALSAADAGDTRRFAGYPAAAAYVYQPLDVQGASDSLDAVLAMLDASSIAVVQTMLTALRQLESDIPAMRDNLDTAKAAVWERNPNEAADREGLFLSMRRRLCAFLGIAPGPGLFVEAAALTSAYPPAVFTV